MTTTCGIYFDKLTVYSGQRLNITVRLNLTKKIMFRDITFQLCGKMSLYSFEYKENILNMKQDLVPRNGGNVFFIIVSVQKISYMNTFNR